MSDRTTEGGAPRIVFEPTEKTSAETIEDLKLAAAKLGLDVLIKTTVEFKAIQTETNDYLRQLLDNQKQILESEKRQSKTVEAIAKAMKKGGVFVSEYLPQILLGLGAWLAVYYHEQLLALHHSVVMLWNDAVSPKITKGVATIMEWWDAKRR